MPRLIRFHDRFRRVTAGLGAPSVHVLLQNYRIRDAKERCTFRLYYNTTYFADMIDTRHHAARRGPGREGARAPPRASGLAGADGGTGPAATTAAGGAPARRAAVRPALALRPGQPARGGRRPAPYAPLYGNETPGRIRSAKHATRVGLTPDLASTRGNRPPPLRASTCSPLEHMSRPNLQRKGRTPRAGMPHVTRRPHTHTTEWQNTNSPPRGAR